MTYRWKGSIFPAVVMSEKKPRVRLRASDRAPHIMIGPRASLTVGRVDGEDDMAEELHDGLSEFLDQGRHEPEDHLFVFQKAKVGIECEDGLHLGAVVEEQLGNVGIRHVVIISVLVQRLAPHLHRRLENPPQTLSLTATFHARQRIPLLEETRSIVEPRIAVLVVLLIQ